MNLEFNDPLLVTISCGVSLLIGLWILRDVIRGEGLVSYIILTLVVTVVGGLILQFPILFVGTLFGMIFG